MLIWFDKLEINYENIKPMLLLFIFNSYKYHRMQPKHIRIHKAVAEKIKIINYENQNSIHMASDKYGVETKSIRN